MNPPSVDERMAALETENARTRTRLHNLEGVTGALTIVQDRVAEMATAIAVLHANVDEMRRDLADARVRETSRDSRDDNRREDDRRGRRDYRIALIALTGTLIASLIGAGAALVVAL